MASEPDLIIEAGFSDARIAREVQAVVAKYKQAGEAAQKAFQDASGKVGDNQALRAHAREMDKLQRAYDPVYVATKRYEKAIEQLDRALKIGAIDQAKYNAEVVRAQRGMAQSAGLTQQAAQVTQQAAQGAGIAGHQFQNVGYQVQDFAVQVASGTSATRAFAQQFPQLASGFGLWGVAIGTAAAVLVPLAGAMLSTGDRAKSLDDRMKDLEKSTDAMLDAATNAARPVHDLADAFGSLADEIARADQAQLFFTRLRAEHDLFGAARSIGTRFGDLAPVPTIMAHGTVDPVLARARDNQIAAMTRLRNETGATEAQAEKLRLALDRMAAANGPKEVAESAAELEQLLVAIAGNASITTKQMDELARQAREAAAVRAQAERQVGAVMSEAQAIIDRYAGTTRQLRELTEEREVAERALAKAQKEGNARLITDLNQVLVNLDSQIAKVKELAREGDISFGRLAAGARNFVGALAQGIVTAVREGDEAAANSGILALIRRRESGGDYNVTLDHGRYTGGPRDLVNMTINEVLQMQREMLAHPDNKKNSSAAGAYQIVRKTLQGLVDELGLTGNELYSREMQDRLAQQLLRRRRGQGIEGLRNEWEGLRYVDDATLQSALGQQSIPLEDPQVESERQKALNEETKERERQLEQVKRYGEQLAASLVTEQQRADLERQRAEAMAAINASDMSEAEKAAAIAMVNAEMQKQLTVFALIEEAKRRQVDLDAQIVGSTMTYRQAIEALGETQKQRAIAEQQAAASADQLKRAQEFAAEQTQALKDGLVDAIIEGENFADVLANVAKALAKAALQAALFGDGPFGGGGSGIWGAIIGAITGGGGNKVSAWTPSYAGGGFTGHGARSGGIDGRGGFPAILHPNETVIDHTLGQKAGGMSYSPTFNIGGRVTAEDLAAVRQEAAMGFAQMQKSLPARVQRSIARPRERF